MKYDDRNKKYKPKVLGKEKVDSNKELLMKQFIDKTKKNKTHNIEYTTEKSEYKVNDESNNEIVNDLKNEINKLKAQVKAEKDKRQVIKQDNDKLEKKNKRLINENDKYTEVINLLNKDKNTLENKVTNLQDYIEPINEELSNLKNKIDILKKQLLDRHLDIANLRKVCEDRKKTIANLEEKPAVEEFKKEIAELKKINYKLNTQLKVAKFDIEMLNRRVGIKEVYAHYIENNNIVETEITVKSIINNLKIKTRKMISQTIISTTYRVKAMKVKYRTFKGNIKHNIYVKRYRYKSKESNVYGNLIKNRFGKYTFISIDGVRYRVRKTSIKNKPKWNNISCVADITEKNKAVVKKTFRETIDISNLEKATKPKIKKINNINKEKQPQVLYSKQYKVLIITALPGINYLSKLSPLGIKVSIFNSYYENAKRLDSILNKYDMVFYCVRHSKHYCKDVIKNQPDYTSDGKKYYILNDDSITTMLYLIDNYISTEEYEKINIIAE